MIQEKTLKLIIEEILNGYKSRCHYHMHFQNFSIWIANGISGIDICAPNTNNKMVVLSFKQKREVWKATLRVGEKKLVKSMLKTNKKGCPNCGYIGKK